MKIKANVTPDATPKELGALKDKYTRVSIHIDRNNTRTKQIEECKVCGGNPELVPIELEGFKGERCANKDCMLVKHWEHDK
jgi:hypothetical protein